jgi:hypothetical protein
VTPANRPEEEGAVPIKQEDLISGSQPMVGRRCLNSSGAWCLQGI